MKRRTKRGERREKRKDRGHKKEGRGKNTGGRSTEKKTKKGGKRKHGVHATQSLKKAVIGPQMHPNNLVATPFSLVSDSCHSPAPVPPGDGFP